MKHMKQISSILLLLIITAFSLPVKKKIKILMAGDSTMAIKQPRAFPETGWGMPFMYFWDSSITVIDKAKNGASTKTFIAEGLWGSIMQNAEAGDYIFIQFGHNDEVPTKKSFTTENEFRTNLIKFISDSRSKNAIPVLLTPVARRKFDSTGQIEGTHEAYSQLVRNVAAEEKVILIDLDKKSQALYQQLGVERSQLLFLHLQKGEHPNYPNGKEDNTHFSELGARLVAQLVLHEIKEKIPELTQRIISRKS
jgi:lysophospholipase L1-like esterase